MALACEIGGDRRGAVASREHQVDAAGLAEGALQGRDRHEQHARLVLPWPERELAERRGRLHAAQAKPQRASGIVAAAEQRAAGDPLRRLGAHEQRRARSGAELLGERRAHERIPLAERGSGDAVERPEARVDPPHVDRRRAPARGGLDHDAAHRQQRDRGAGRRREPLGEGRREGACADDRHVGFSDASQGERPQARAHRVADEQRARQHRDRHGDSEHDRGVRRAMVDEAAENQRPQPHQAGSSRRPSMRRRCGRRAASSALCVTSTSTLGSAR